VCSRALQLTARSVRRTERDETPPMFWHRQENVPAYRLRLHARPGIQNKGKDRYIAEIKAAASEAAAGASAWTWLAFG